MSNGYMTKEKILRAAPVDCAAGATTVISEVFPLSAADSKNFLARVTLSAAGETTGASIVLQDSPGALSGVDPTWSTVKSASIASIANVDTITYGTFAAAAHGDYNILTDAAGNTW